MIPPNEFWLRLHEVAQAHHASGKTPEERDERILNHFEEMSGLAQQEIVRDLVRVMTFCHDLYPVAVALDGARRGHDGQAKS